MQQYRYLSEPREFFQALIRQTCDNYFGITSDFAVWNGDLALSPWPEFVDANGASKLCLKSRHSAALENYSKNCGNGQASFNG